MTSQLSRRQMIFNSLVVGASGLTVAASARAQSADVCTGNATPRETEGPFYPVTSHPEFDADLTQLAGHARRARGEVVDVVVRVQNEACEPIADARMHIWQACSTGKYDHPNDTNEAALDPGFQYFADLHTSAEGSVVVRTIKPGSYPASATWSRPPHIHFIVAARGFTQLTTQMYFAGEALNAVDEILLAHDPAEAETLIVKLIVGDATEVPRGTFTITLRAAR